MTYLQARTEINTLLDSYLTPAILTTRLRDIASQFETPHARPWQPIRWKNIHVDQIVDVDPELFIQVIASAAEIEDPIREYSQESQGYLQPIHPAMARFVGGRRADDGRFLELGVWEKEERQHGPTFSKIHQQLTGIKLQANPNTVAGYQPTQDPRRDADCHLLSRISTEWSATGIYIWLAAHSTGDLHQAIVEPLQDEINHLAKFWGFSRWAFGNSYLDQLRGTTGNLLLLLQHHQGERTHGADITRQASMLKRMRIATELSFTLSRILVRLYSWDRQLQHADLESLFAGQQKAA